MDAGSIPLRSTTARSTVASRWSGVVFANDPRFALQIGVLNAQQITTGSCAFANVDMVLRQWVWPLTPNNPSLWFSIVFPGNKK